MPRTSTEPAPYNLDDQVGHLLRRAYQRASANLSARLQAYDLTPTQFAVLARLREQGPVSQNRLGRMVAMEPPNIRDVVLRLRKRGLLRTTRDAGDRRLSLIGLSAAGQQLVEGLLPLSEVSSAATLEPLNIRERTVLLDLLRRIAD